MAFNPFNLFKGNPKVQELMTKNEQMDVLLLQEAFISEFKRTENDALQTYMSYEKYQKLIDYITIANEQQSENKNKSFKFPFVAAEILSSNNDITYKYLLEEVVFIEEEVEQQIEVEKQIDSQSSERSYSSIKSNSSIKSGSSNTSKKEKVQLKTFEEHDKQNFVLSNNHDLSVGDFNNKQEKQICQDDFPDAKMRKTIIVKEMVKRVVKKPLEPLIFQLIFYFQNHPVIHILDGYVCKVLESVINNKFEVFINITKKYNKFTCLKSIFTHIESNSVQQLLLNFISKLIQLENLTSMEDVAILMDFIQDHCLQRFQQWENSSLSTEDRAYYLSLYGLIIDKLNGKIKSKDEQLSKDQNFKFDIQRQLQILSTIVNNKHIEQITSILKDVIQNYEKNSQYAKITWNYLKILKNSLNCFLQLKIQKKNTKLSKEQHSTIKQLIKECEDAFDSLINIGLAFTLQNFASQSIEKVKAFKPKYAMSTKLQFLDIIGKLLQQNIYFSKRTITDNLKYEQIHILFDIYSSSSIMHNGVVKMITPFLTNDNDSAILNTFFSKKKLLSFIYTTVKQDFEIRYQKLQKTRKCYIGQITSICLLIDRLTFEQSQSLTAYKQSKEWKYIREGLVEEEKGMGNKVLGGLSKQRQKRPIIFFSKNESLNHFKHFLNGVKFNIFDEFQNYQPSNSDSEDQNNQNKAFTSQQTTFAETNPLDDVDEKMVDDSKYFDQNVQL